MSRPSRSAWTRTSATPVRAAELGRGRRGGGRWRGRRPARRGRRRAAGGPARAAARRPRASAGRVEERAVRDRRVDPGQVLEHRPAGAEVQVADLGVAHLPGRQADGVLGRPEDAVRPAREEAAPDRHGAAAIASAAGSWPIPKPSRTTRTIGRGRRAASVTRSTAARAAAVRPARADDPGHLVGLERGAADERAVDRGLGQELADVGRR